MDINLKEHVNEKEHIEDKDTTGTKNNEPADGNNLSEEKEKKEIKNPLITSSWGILLLLLFYAVISVASYAPLKNYIFPSFSRIPDYQIVEGYIILILSIGGLSLLVLTIATFAITYSSQKKAGIIKSYNKLFLELKVLLWIGFLMLFIFVLQQISFQPYGSKFNYLIMLRDANLFFFLIGVPITFVIVAFMYMNICYVKHIYHEGFIEGFFKKSIMGKLFYLIANSIKKLSHCLLTMNKDEESHKNLLKLLGIHLIVLGLISMVFPFGMILAVVYTGLLFSYLVKILDKARDLNKASYKLSEGNFDISVSEDMGILSPYAKNLNNIKEGFKLAVEREVRSQNMKTELISNVSHDLKTPLTSIITYIDLLKKDDLDETTKKEYMDILDRKSKRLKVLIEDLFEASKASSGNIELHMENLDAVALLRQTLGELEEKIKESTLHMRIKLPDKAICQLDGKKTYRVFDNVIGNILKYAMPNSRVYIEGEETDKEISFIFKNISAYEMNFNPAEIAERFTRGDKSRNTEGSGLGLAIAKSLVELQNGSMTINIDGDLFKLIITFPKTES